MPLLWISLAFIAGLILGESMHWSGAGWVTAAGICLLAWPGLRFLPSRPGILDKLRWGGLRHAVLRVPPVMLLAFLFAGAARITSSAPDLAHGHIAGYNDQGSVQIQAVVAAAPDRRERTTLLRLEIETAAILDENGAAAPAKPAHGRALALLPAGVEWEYGDRLLLTGKPGAPPEGEEFSYRDYLARQDIYTYIVYPRVLHGEHGTGNPIFTAIYALRDLALKEIYRIFPAPEAPLLAGILLGIENDIPPALAQAFRDTGTAHVIAISGFNIAILAALFSKLFGKILSRWWATLAAILAIAFYTILVGAAASVVRAAIMGSLALIAAQIGRRSTGVNSLALAAALMCLGNPRLPWDTSFQLSFFATLGLILYGERFQSGLSEFLNRRLPAEAARRIAGPVGEYVLLTLAAQLTTLPIILYHFQRLSLSALLANPLILPAQPLLMILSGAAVVAGLIFAPLGQALAWLAWPLSAYTIRMVEALAGLPGGVLVTGRLNLLALILLYAAVLAPVLGWRFPRLWKELLRPGLLLAALGLTAAIAWRGAAARPDGRLHLVVLNLESSQVVLVRGPGGGTILAGGGPSATLLADALGRWLSPLDRRLDVLLVNNPQAQAISGLPGVLERYPVGQALWGCTPGDSRASEALLESFASNRVVEEALAPGQALEIGSGARLEVLAVSENGSALLLRWGNFRALIPAGVPPGDIKGTNLAQMSALVLEERDLEWKEKWVALAPQAVVYTVGKGALAVDGVNWLNVQPQGWVHILTDGKQLWVEQSQ